MFHKEKKKKKKNSFFPRTGKQPPEPRLECVEGRGRCQEDRPLVDDLEDRVEVGLVRELVVGVGLGRRDVDRAGRGYCDTPPLAARRRRER